MNRKTLNPECFLTSERFVRGRDIFQYSFGVLEALRLVSRPERKRKVKRMIRAVGIQRMLFDDPCNPKHVIENPAILERAVKKYKDRL